MRRAAGVGLLFAALGGGAHAAAPAPTPCRLHGVAHEARCGSITRALDPAREQGPTIELHFAVLPALARQPAPDPVFFIAGGPGQSAIDLAGPVGRMLGRLGRTRDIVLVDQRGTGRSAPLRCDDDSRTPPLREADPQAQLAEVEEARLQLVEPRIDARMAPGRHAVGARFFEHPGDQAAGGARDENRGAARDLLAELGENFFTGGARNEHGENSQTI